MKYTILLLLVFHAGSSLAATISVHPEITRSIQGESELDRQRYFSLCDHGTDFDRRVSGGTGVYDELVHQLGVSFGRSLGPVKGWAQRLPEDPDRPGYADLSKLKRFRPPMPSPQMVEDFDPHLHVAAHGQHNAYPTYMGEHYKGSTASLDHPKYIPENIDAATELAAAVLQYGYTDFNRPVFFEPINEPHWEFYRDAHLVDWHLKTLEAVHQATPGVKVGGPCLPVCYFYRDNYKSWNGLQRFIDGTAGRMDFYSFHAYDYFRWEEGEYFGRIQTGLPLEGVLDLVQNYTMNTFGKEVDIVISEQGGYNALPKGGAFAGDIVASEIAARHFPGDTFEHEMKKRSIVNSLMIGSVVANTLTFMDHPHTVQKAVPFLLPTTWNWDPHYYAQLYVPYDFEDRSRWVPTHLLDFYRYFRDVQGRRVKALCDDPDLQARAIVHENRLFLMINNQSYRPETVALSGISSPTVTLRRLGRNRDFTGYYREETVTPPKSLTLAGREAVMLVATYEEAITENGQVNEVVCYGDQVTLPMKDAQFTIRVPVEQHIDYAVLRVGLTRESGKSHHPVITLNGKALEVPLEDCADRLDSGEYATTKLITLKVADLRRENTVTVSFPDGDAGAVGTAVIRTAIFN